MRLWGSRQFCGGRAVRLALLWSVRRTVVAVRTDAEGLCRAVGAARGVVRRGSLTASVPESAGIFISYRRDDAAYPAGWLCDELTRHFGERRLFQDIDSIQPGDDFAARITTTLKSCAVLLVVIGTRWLTAAANGRRRLDDPADWVRLEIETALMQGLRIIPVLVEGAKMPGASELPASLQALAGRQAQELSPARFRADAERLANVLKADYSGPGDIAQERGPSRLVRTLTVHTIWRPLPGDAGVCGVAFSPDGTLLASAGTDKKVRIWQAAAGTAVRTLTGHTGRVWAVAFSTDGALLASAGSDNSVRVWQVVTGETVRTLAGHNKLRYPDASVCDLAFSPDGTLLASAGVDGTIRIWEIATGAAVRTLTGHDGWVRAVAFSPDGTLLVSAGEDKTVRVWQTKTGAPVGTLTGHTGRVWAVAFSPDGTLLASAGADRTVRIWGIATGAAVRILTDHAEGALTAGPDDKTARALEVAAGVARTVTHIPDGVLAVAFSPDGTLLASAGVDRTVRIWETATGAVVRTLTGHTSRVSAVAFSPDGTLLASAGNDLKVRLWG